MELFIIAFAAFYIGFKISEFIHVTSFKKILEDLQINSSDLKRLAKINGLELPEAAEAAVDEDRVEVKIEQHEGLLFVYEIEGGRLVTQGKTPDEIMQRLVEVYPKGTTVVCDREQGGSLLTEAAERIKAQTT